MKSLKSLMRAAFYLSLVVTLLGCQAAPEKNIVVNKSNSTVTENHDEPIVASDVPESTGEETRLQWSKLFSSADGTIDILFDIDENIYYQTMPVYTVVPHCVTNEEAKEVANVLFPDGDFFEARPDLDRKWSKKELQERINRWGQYTNKAAIENLFGRAKDDDVQLLRKRTQDLTLQMENAGTELPTILCKWTYQKSLLYDHEENELDRRSLENDNDEIRAEVVEQELHYQFISDIRDKSDFQLNNIYAFLDFGPSPMDIDDRIFTAMLCRTDKPSSEQIMAVCEKAEHMLEQFPFGDWKIDEYKILTNYYGENAEYKVCVRAVPVFNGIAAVRCPQLANLKNPNVYASTYYLTDVYMEFSPDGHLLDFKLFSPVDIIDSNSEHSTLSMEELLDQAAAMLSLKSVPEEELYKIHGEIKIDHLEYGLVRTKMPENDEGYYYVPAIVLKGQSTYSVEDTGELYSESNTDMALLCLNAMDGSVIQLWQ